jgi:hypothetical protein
MDVVGRFRKVCKLAFGSMEGTGGIQQFSKLKKGSVEAIKKVQ